MTHHARAKFWDVNWVPVPSNRVVRILFAVATVVAVGLLAWLFWLIMSLSGELEAVQKGQTKTEVQTFNLAQQWESACQEKKVNASLKPLCDYSKQIREGTQKGLPPLPQLPGPKGDKGDKGEPPTFAQMVTAAKSVCSTTTLCQAPPSKPGQAVTMAQVLAAMEEICSTTTLCQGPQGEKGEPGADSTVPGPEGPAGPAGPPGPTGGVTCPVGYTAGTFTVNTPSGHRTAWGCLKG